MPPRDSSNVMNYNRLLVEKMIKLGEMNNCNIQEKLTLFLFSASLLLPPFKYLSLH